MSNTDKFKVGDKVRVVVTKNQYQWDHTYKYPNAWIFGMDKYIGCEFLVSQVRRNGVYLVNEHNENYCFPEQALELVTTKEKKYRMVGTHELVRVICTDVNHPRYPNVGLYTNKEGYEGVVCFGEGSGVVEEVPKIDWSKVKIDTPIWVESHTRHFAKYENNAVYFYANGLTSHTNNALLVCADQEKVYLEKPQ